jgi:hypothetical protein
MDRPLRALGENILSGLSWNSPTPNPPNRYWVYVDQAGWTGNYLSDPDNEFASGFIDLSGVGWPPIGFPVLESEVDIGMDYVTVPVPGGSWTGPTSGTYEMCDDDCDLATWLGGTFTSTVGTGYHLGAPDLSWMQSRFGAAYIEPTQETAFTNLGGPAFVRNPGASYMQDLWDAFKGFRGLPVSTSGYWTVQICVGFQGPLGEDHDPDTETATPAVCTHNSGSTSAVWWLGSSYTGMAAVFRETIHDLGSEDRYPYYVVHETAHTLGADHVDVGPLNIMNSVAGESIGEWFAPQSIQALREYAHP